MLNKCALVIPRRNSGGVESYSLNLKNIGSNKIPVEIIYLSDHGIPDNSVKSLYYINKYHNLIKDYDIVICHGQYGYISLFHKNVYTIIHGNPFSYFLKASSLNRLLNPKSWILTVSDSILVNISILFSKKIVFVADHVKNSYFFSNFKLIINKSISNTTKHIVNQEISDRENNKFIAVISDAHHEKGLDRLVRVSELLNIKIEVYGTENRNNLNFKNIIFRGKLQYNQLLAEMKSANLLFHLSRYEGLPLSVIEAISFGVPCILSKASWSEIFKGLNSILLIDNNDLNDTIILTNKINTLKNISAENIKNEYLKFLKNINLIENL